MGAGRASWGPLRLLPPSSTPPKTGPVPAWRAAPRPGAINYVEETPRAHTRALTHSTPTEGLQSPRLAAGRGAGGEGEAAVGARRTCPPRPTGQGASLPQCQWPVPKRVPRTRLLFCSLQVLTPSLLSCHVSLGKSLPLLWASVERQNWGLYLRVGVCVCRRAGGLGVEPWVCPLVPVPLPG